MLGNWSLGDYFKQESLAWSYEFLTAGLGIDPARLAVTVFAGDADAPRDEECAEAWRRLGIPSGRIYFLSKQDNWWGPVGDSGPCGPDSEIFYDTGLLHHPGVSRECRPGCPCGKWLEVWNNVFMEYNRTPDGRYTRLRQRNVDTGMGVERTLAALQGYEDVFKVDTIFPVLERLEELSGKHYSDQPRPFRVVADHLRAATLAIADGAYPSNVEAGYVVRRLVRRAVRFGRELGIQHSFCADVAQVVIGIFASVYPPVGQNQEQITAELEREETRFQGALDRGLRRYHKVVDRLVWQGAKTLPGEEAFDLYETYGFPLPLTVELASEQGLEVDQAGFERLYAEHQELSRRGTGQKFRGGLADNGQATTLLHTATHLLHASLRRVLGPEVRQMGSNITPERLRFDFSYPEKLTPEQVAQVEALVNEQIGRDLPVSFEVMPLEQALESGALAFFGEKYGEQVKVYSVGDFSKEVCGGPHAARTGELGRFRIIKQDAVGQGVRRLRAVLEYSE
jgi:alanyl-tRNA synthetase